MEPYDAPLVYRAYVSFDETQPISLLKVARAVNMLRRMKTDSSEKLREAFEALPDELKTEAKLELEEQGWGESSEVL